MSFNPLIIGSIQESGSASFAYSHTGSPTDGTYTDGGTTYRALVWTSSGSLTFIGEAKAVQYLLIAAGGGGGGAAAAYQAVNNGSFGASGAGGSGVVIMRWVTEV